MGKESIISANEGHWGIKGMFRRVLRENLRTLCYSGSAEKKRLQFRQQMDELEALAGSIVWANRGKKRESFCWGVRTETEVRGGFRNKFGDAGKKAAMQNEEPHRLLTKR